MVMLLYFSVVFYGMNVARSVVEEKTSRIFEVLLATAKPESLMAGKLLGVGSRRFNPAWPLACLREPAGCIRNDGARRDVWCR